MKTVTTHALLVASLALLVACPGRNKEAVPGLPGDGTDHFRDGAKTGDQPAKDPWADRELIESPPVATAVAVELPETERFTLKNGLEVIAVRDPSLPVVSMQLAIRAGKSLETRDHVGLSSFAAEMLTRGSGKRDAAAIARSIDFVGGTLDASASFEATLVSCKVMSKDVGTCLDLVPDVVARPSFPASEIDLVRKDLHAVVRQRLDDAGQLANAHFQTFLWGPDHVRGWPLTAATIDAIDRKDLLAWHRAWVRPNNSVLAIAGDIDPKKLRASLERAFRGWKRAPLGDRPEYQPRELDGLRVLLVDKPDQSQSHLRLGHFGISHKDDDFYAAMVVNYTLGGGAFSSRLLQSVRSREGKTYTASSSFDRNLDVGAFVAATFTRTPETVATVRLVRDEIARMASAGPTPAEVTDAETNLAGSYAMRFETAGDFAGALLAADLHDFGPEYVRDYPLRIAAVTAEDATRVAASLLDPADMVIVIVGNAAEVEPQLREAGWVYEKVGHLESVAPWERTAKAEAASAPVDPRAAAAARKILEGALRAKGGAKRLERLKTLTWKGKAELTLPGGKVPAEVTKRIQRPDRLRLDMNIAGGQVVATTVLRGDQAWGREVSPRGDKTVDFPKNEIDALRTQVWREQDLVLLRHREKGARVEPIEDRSVDGRATHGVRLTSADGTRTVDLFIDEKTRALAAMEYSEQGMTATETFADYKKVGGISIAHRRHTKSPQLELAIDLESVKLDAKLPPELFEKGPGDAAAAPPK